MVSYSEMVRANGECGFVKEQQNQRMTDTYRMEGHNGLVCL